ncbi:MAG TPA: ESPR domain-containing protein, partial [Gallionella sp.]|nr:ESPR domain-containing protein [Gallionella sp.]
MNKAYRLIWNELTNTWVAVAENVRGRGKRASGAVLLAASGFAFAAPPVATQLPTGGQVVAGVAGINQSGAVLNINQSTQNAAINWQTFNVGSAAQVNFNQ